jgi:hypothetical protein
MGYEVIDSGEGPPPGTARGGGPVEVVDLDDVPRRGDVPPAPRPQGHPERPDGSPTGPPQALAGPLGQGRAALESFSRTTKVLTAALLTMLVAVGALAGARVGSDRAHAAAAREARGVVSATAVLEGFVASGDQRTTRATSEVTVTNLGRYPLHLVGRDPAGSPATPQIEVHGDPVVPPGGVGRLGLTLPVDCASTDQLAVAVPVQADDGSTHQLTAQMTVASQVLPTGADVCLQNGSQQSLQAELTGTVAAPRLKLLNAGMTALRVGIDAVGSSGAQLVTVDTVPALPLLLGAGQQKELPLAVKVLSCTVALSDTGNGAGYVQLSAQPADDATGAPQITQGVDVSVLIGAAITRQCR